MQPHTKAPSSPVTYTTPSPEETHKGVSLGDRAINLLITHAEELRGKGFIDPAAVPIRLKDGNIGFFVCETYGRELWHQFSKGLLPPGATEIGSPQFAPRSYYPVGTKTDQDNAVWSRHPAIWEPS